MKSILVFIIILIGSSIPLPCDGSGINTIAPNGISESVIIDSYNVSVFGSKVIVLNSKNIIITNSCVLVVYDEEIKISEDQHKRIYQKITNKFNKFP